MQDNKNGWAWFAAPQAPAHEDQAELALAYARCFRGADGLRVLEHLKSMTIEQALGPSASDALLRHMEGQRQLVNHIFGLIERGRGNTIGDTK